MGAQKSFRHNFKRLFKRLENGNIVFYCGNHWLVFSKIIPQNRLFQGKEKTLSIEQNNSRQHHWFARFRHKTLLNSKSLGCVKEINVVI